MNKRRVAVVVAAVVPVLSIAIAFAVTRGGSDRPARLPVAASGGERAAAGATADAAVQGAPAPALYPAGGIVYEAGEGLPTLDGTGRAYRLRPVGEDAVRRLATALGLSGDPVAQDGGGLVVQDGDRTLSVYPQLAGAWSYFRGGPEGSTGSGVAVATAPACGGPDCPVTSPPADCKDTADCGFAPPDPVRPGDLPTQDEAKATALDLLTNAGVDVDGADVNVDDGFTAWSVRLDPTVDGISTSGLTSYVAVGSQGVIDYANGYLAVPEPADEYPLTGTAAAIERMNNGEGFGGGVRPLAADAGAAGAAEPAPASDLPMSVDPAEPTETIVPGEGVAPGEPAPGKPLPEPQPEPLPDPEPVEPQRVTLTGARQVLVFAPSIDGTEGWLVPGYELTAGEGEGPVVMAVEGEFLQ